MVMVATEESYMAFESIPVLMVFRRAGFMERAALIPAQNVRPLGNKGRLGHAATSSTPVDFAIRQDVNRRCPLEYASHRILTFTCRGVT